MEESGAGQIVAIIIDDADELSQEDFTELRTLLSLRSDGRHLVQIVLVGSPALTLLNDPALKSLRQRVRVWAKVPPLASHEVEAYIEHKLSFAGSILRGLFQAPAVARIAAYSQGIPKTIDALCDRSLRLAYLRARDPITEPIVEDAWKVLRGGGGSEPEIEARSWGIWIHDRAPNHMRKSRKRGAGRLWKIIPAGKRSRQRQDVTRPRRDGAPVLGSPNVAAA